MKLIKKVFLNFFFWGARGGGGGGDTCIQDNPLNCYDPSKSIFFLPICWKLPLPSPTRPHPTHPCQYIPECGEIELKF